MKEMKMMLVDDEERFLSTTKKLLARKGHDVLTATSGPEALEMLREHNIHVVILDVKMPGMDGIELRRRLAKIDPTMKFILVTGHGSDRDYDVGMKEVSYYIIKPFKIEDLVDKLRGLSGQ